MLPLCARVIVVHDVPAIRTVVSQALVAVSCTVIGVEDWTSARELAATDPPDVILTDERVIEADAREFQRLRDELPNVPVVALAAPLRSRRTSLRGVDCSIEKPARDEELVRAVTWAVELRGTRTVSAR